MLPCKERFLNTEMRINTEHYVVWPKQKKTKISWCFVLLISGRAIPLCLPSWVNWIHANVAFSVREPGSVYGWIGSCESISCAQKDWLYCPVHSPDLFLLLGSHDHTQIHIQRVSAHSSMSGYSHFINWSVSQKLRTWQRESPFREIVLFAFELLNRKCALSKPDPQREQLLTWLNLEKPSVSKILHQFYVWDDVL